VSIARKTSEEYQGSAVVSSSVLSSSVLSSSVLSSMRVAKCLGTVSVDYRWN
jgi:hypothetical protein